MTIEQLWKIVRRRWLLIVACFLIVGAGAFVGSKLTKPTYQSSVLVQVVISSAGSSSASFDNLQASDDLVQTESTLATSDPVLSAVASHYPDLSLGDLSDEVTADPKTSTQIFEIVVTDRDPDRAASLANDIAATLIKQQLQAMQQSNTQAQQQIQQTMNQLSEQIDTLTTKITSLQAKTGTEGQVAVLQTQLSELQQSYNQWQTSLAQLQLAAAGNVSPMQVVQPATPNDTPVKPTTTLNTAGGLVAGLLLGVLLALLYEGLDKRIRTSEELGLLLKWPVLATIWRVKSSHPEDLINPTGNDANVEAYRILRTNLDFANVDRPVRTLVVTSALSLEGKSVVAANLAIFMAKAGKNTLLVDADLRRPTVYKKFGLSAEKKGLSNAILAFGNSDIVKNISQSSAPRPLADNALTPFMHAVNIPNLMVMPSGPLPPNPSDLLASKALQTFFEVLTMCSVEIVVFDTAPLLGLSDSTILVTKVESTLLVVDIDRANRKNLKQVQALLTQSKAHVTGCVVNKQRPQSRDLAYSYFYQTDDLSSNMSVQKMGTGENPQNGPISANPPKGEGAPSSIPVSAGPISRPGGD